MTDTSASEPFLPVVPRKRSRSASNCSSPSEPDAKYSKTTASLAMMASGSPDASGFPMKRRVNPESLASRLAPDLVREMNELILSGENKEMPSFAVRKDLQVRYNIDRRHIYDYFHSMGLRVIKHDGKSNNLANVLDYPRTIKPRPIRQAPPVVPRAIGHDISAPRAFPTAPTRARKPPRTLPKPSSQKSHQAAFTPSFCQISDYPLKNPPEHFESLEMVEDTYGDTLSSAYPTDDGLSHMRAISGSTLSCTKGSIQRQPCDTQMAFPDFSSNLALGFVIPGVRDNNADYVSPPLPERPVSQKERLSMYKFIDDNLRPARGVEESVGSYKSYMKERSRLYYARLFDNFPDASKSTPVQTIQVRSADTAREPVDYRTWLLSVPSPNGSDDPYVNGKASSPLSNTPKKRDGRIPLGDTCIGQDSRFSFSPQVPRDDHGLDSLFPKLPIDGFFGVNHVLESPVVRSKRTEPTSPILEKENECCIIGEQPKTLLNSAARSRSPSRGSQTNFSSIITSGSPGWQRGEATTSLLLAPSMTPSTTLSRRLRTGTSFPIGHNRALTSAALPLTKAVPDDSIGSYYTRSVFNLVSPSPVFTRYRSRSFSATPIKSRTISVGGGF